MSLEKEIQSWKQFHDFLRIDERMIFDDLMNLARERASAAGAATRLSITEAMFMTLLFQHHRIIRQLQKMLEKSDHSIEEQTSRIRKRGLEIMAFLERLEPSCEVC